MEALNNPRKSEIGKHLKRVNLYSLIDPKFPVRSGAANSDILKSYLALLFLGNSDFDPTESFRGIAFFMRALALAVVASSPTLSQRMGKSNTKKELVGRTYTAALVSTPLLVRANSGFCSARLMQEVTAQAAALDGEIAFLIIKAAKMIHHAGRWGLGIG